MLGKNMHAVAKSQPKFYTGIGSRETPYQVQKQMQRIAQYLAKKGYTLRSGSAAGADSAFEAGALREKGSCACYLPWPGFNNRVLDENHIHIHDVKLLQQADDILKTVHPAYDRLKGGAKSLHLRNVFQVLGDDLRTPSNLLICFAAPTLEGVKGGTNSAWQIAQRMGIPCYNLWHSIDRYNLVEELENL